MLSSAPRAALWIVRRDAVSASILSESRLLHAAHGASQGPSFDAMGATVTDEEFNALFGPAE